MSNSQHAPKIQTLVATFENGDQLDLTLEKQAQYGTYLPADIWVLTYAERYEGSYDDLTSEGHFFMTTQSEYFPSDKAALAKEAFDIRLRSGTPAKSSGRGLRMNEFLTERPNQLGNLVKQLQIRPRSHTGAPGDPIKYPAGCEHAFSTDTCVFIYHPADINPAWCPDQDNAVPKYLVAYARQSCSRGLVVEYVDVPE